MNNGFSFIYFLFLLLFYFGFFLNLDKKYNTILNITVTKVTRSDRVIGHTIM